MITYSFLQNYWWFIVSLLGALLVFLLFVQGANSMVHSLGATDEGRRLVVNSTGRKWEFTFTTLVTFGGAFFASFPLFYSTSFGGAYWLWMLILFTFVLQAVSYEFQNKLGNFLGPRTFQFFLVLNGIIGPLLLGGAVATFFEGSNFIVVKENLVNSQSAITPVISSWGNVSHGLDALLNPWVLVFGFAVVFLARILGTLYIINNVADEDIQNRSRHSLLVNAVPFVILFVAYLVHLLLKEGYAYNAEGYTLMEPFKYLNNLLTMWYLLLILLVGVVLVLWGIASEAFKGKCALFDNQSSVCRGIWPAGVGTVLTVLALLLCAGWNMTAYYPSTAELQSSLTISNSCSSEFTLRTMFYVSFLVPFVLAYIVYCWRAIDKKKLDREELKGDHAY
jgi:cytochrome d ubiquinol oxidase subunit II